MKKLITLLLALMISIGAASAEIYVFEDSVTMTNFWEKNGKETKKVLLVAQKIMSSNKLNKRVPVILDKSTVPNAMTNGMDRRIIVYKGLLPLIDNDDELAFILAHEMAHDMDFYGGFLNYTAMTFNSKKYEVKADTKAVDYMVNAGYDPISAIISINKIAEEPMIDWLASHPRGTKRMMNLYKYIYVKYPQALNSPKTSSPYYKNFLYTMNEEIQEFHQDQLKRKKKNEGITL